MTELSDRKNPDYVFCLTDNDILMKAVTGQIDLLELAKRELAGRGIDYNGKFVGFALAKNGGNND